MGWWAGKITKNRIPYFTGIKQASRDQLKSLGAAMAASGAVAMYHIQNITPESNQPLNGLEKFSFSESDLKDSYEKLSDSQKPEILIFGCPHSSLEEIKYISEKIGDNKLNKPLWICTARAIKQQASERGYLQKIEQAGGKILADTCMVVSPIEEFSFRSVAVNSGKSACYLSGFCKKDVVFSSMDKLIEEALA